MKNFKKALAVLMATATMAVGVAGLSAGAAYIPGDETNAGVTGTRTFDVNGYTATAYLYRDSSKSSASTSLSTATSVTVQLTVNTVSYFDSSTNGYVSVVGAGSSSPVISYHTASRNGKTGSTTMQY